MRFFPACGFCLFTLHFFASSVTAFDLAAGSANVEDGKTKARGNMKLDWIPQTGKLTMPISMNLFQSGKGITGKSSIAVIVMDKDFKTIYSHSKELSVEAKPNGSENYKDYSEVITIPPEVAALVGKNGKFTAFKVVIGQETRLPENAEAWKKEIEDWEEQAKKLQTLKVAEYQSAAGWDFIRMAVAKRVPPKKKK